MVNYIKALLMRKSDSLSGLLSRVGLFAHFNGKEISFYGTVRFSYPVFHSKRGSSFDSFRSLETLEQLLLLTGFCCLFLPI